MTDITAVLGKDADDLLLHACKSIPKSSLHLPGPDFVDRVVAGSDRSPGVMRSLQQMFDHGRLAGTGYLSILPVDQGIEHSAGASFAKNPMYFDPENIVRLAIEGGCNAVASTLGVLGACSRKYAHRIPFLLKINHNEFLTYPNRYDQILFASIAQAKDMGAVAVGATIYFGSAESGRQIVEVSRQFEIAHGAAPPAPVHFGGPVEPRRGFVLHALDWAGQDTVEVAGRWALSGTIDVLRAIADGTGPSRYVAALGYAGWSAGQLDAELSQPGWFHVAGDDALLFDTPAPQRWSSAFAKAGIDPRLLVVGTGTA